MSDRNDVQVQAYYDRTNRNEANFRESRNTFDIDFPATPALAAAAKGVLGTGRARGSD